MTTIRRYGALLALTLTLVLAACSSPEDFNKPVGLEPQFGDGWDNIGYDITSPFAGRVYVLSKTDSFDSYYEEFEDGYSDYYYDIDTVLLSRYDGNGKVIWIKEIASEYCNGCSASIDVLSAHSDKNGYGYSFIKDEFGDHIVIKTDSQGNVVREISLDSFYWDDNPEHKPANLKVAVDPSGNIYFARINRRFYNEPGEYEYTNRLSKYNTNGVLQWERTLPSSTGTPTGVAISGSNLYVVGTKGYAKYTSSGNLTWSKTGSGNDITVAGSYFYIRRGTAVLKYDSNGKQLWSKTQSGLSSPVYGEMTGDTAGNIYLSGKYAASSSNRNGFVRKLNSSGSVLWTKTFGTSAYDDVRGITSVSGSEIYITGETQGSLAHSNRGGDNNRDAYIRELNSSGNPVWTK